MGYDEVAHRSEAMGYLAAMFFACGVLAAYTLPAARVLESILPRGALLATVALLLGSCLYNSYASALFAFALGLRVAPEFQALASALSVMWNSLDTFSTSAAEQLALTPDTLFRTLVVFCTGMLLSLSAAGFGAMFRRPSGAAAYHLVLFAASAALLAYMGALQ